MISEQPLKLHLGCGEKYLEGYWNIDFPEAEHSVMTPRVDEYADVRTLKYPENSLDEIRSHHLFEHFSRAEALKLLTKWRTWLKPGGLLVIETPDFTASADAFLASYSLRRRFQLARHIFGSQEAHWAQHKDFWDKGKFAFVLGKFGFRCLKVRRYRNGLARNAEKISKIGKLLHRLPESLYVPFLNIIGAILPERFYQEHGGNKMPSILVRARKDASIRFDEMKAVREILSMCLMGREGDRMLDVWLKDYNDF